MKKNAPAKSPRGLSASSPAQLREAHRLHKLGNIGIADIAERTGFLSRQALRYHLGLTRRAKGRISAAMRRALADAAWSGSNLGQACARTKRRVAAHASRRAEGRPLWGERKAQVIAMRPGGVIVVKGYYAACSFVSTARKHGMLMRFAQIGPRTRRKRGQPAQTETAWKRSKSATRYRVTMVGRIEPRQTLRAA